MTRTDLPAHIVKIDKAGRITCECQDCHIQFRDQFDLYPGRKYCQDCDRKNRAAS